MINMKCPRCGSEVKSGWSYCPVCGFKLKRVEEIPTDIFSIVEREMKAFNKLFEKDFEFFDLTPWFRKGRKGFTIKIIQESGKEPRITVKTYGDIDREKVEKELYDRFGIKSPLKAQPERKRVIDISTPKITEEPRSEIRRVGDKLIVDIHLPGVKKEEDIDIKVLENSVEVKAFAGEKVYFKILTKPPEFDIARYAFENEILHLEFEAK
ncbi:MAG TPA: zinc-ribbon domain-containing protein [Candidatus Aenigmarchaeota archaeon]|nr:MAG: hypothetical protein DRP03_02820 [Candidatus Aenigmarchaeota archaeon]HDD45935.1 zinc-ribbon domain-containing protein [Candidatus Aenigmarchaeota archaeon]